MPLEAFGRAPVRDTPWAESSTDVLGGGEGGRVDPSPVAPATGTRLGRRADGPACEGIRVVAEEGRSDGRLRLPTRTPAALPTSLSTSRSPTERSLGFHRGSADCGRPAGAQAPRTERDVFHREPVGVFSAHIARSPPTGGVLSFTRHGTSRMVAGRSGATATAETVAHPGRERGGLPARGGTAIGRSTTAGLSWPHALRLRHRPRERVGGRGAVADPVGQADLDTTRRYALAGQAGTALAIGRCGVTAQPRGDPPGSGSGPFPSGPRSPRSAQRAEPTSRPGRQRESAPPEPRRCGASVRRRLERIHSSKVPSPSIAQVSMAPL
ncbi:hypothetical protein SAMN02745673_00392 [Marinactinospora thermotolerans DSM 45154]|uniref:Uncharacterized protein n=1 Tax=Marinactinospora thermotolerans DSM 45154 TaxID=1122192 RepID=A0A1T4KI35_9ACTN|nr:hypothetical protein SAMN02745673_00392 [Marinactinospora thermotolerans DSM 45154]